jgi:hypothetical protein
MLNMKIVAPIAGAFIGLLALTGSASAVTYTPDNLLGSADLGNSGAAIEKSTLASFAGVDVNDLTFVGKVEKGATDLPVMKDDAGNWFIDIAPDAIGYFILKFGTGNSGKDSHYFFENLADLTKLVFTTADVNGLIDSTACQGCNVGKLSHYSMFNAVTAVPVPAALPLLAGGLGLLGFVGSRRKSSKTA